MGFFDSPGRPAAPRDPAFRTLRTAIFSLAVFFTLPWTAIAQKSPTAEKSSTGQMPAARKPARAALEALTGGAPRLVVVVVVGPFRADYLDRFRAQFGSGGFARLMREGAVFRACFYPYAITETGPGHATL